MTDPIYLVTMPLEDNLMPSKVNVAMEEINSPPPPISVIYKPEKMRWFVLAVVAVLNLSNAMMWISFAPITNFTEEFYCPLGGCDTAVWLSLIFMILCIPIGFVAIWGVDSFGLRTGILIGAWLNMIGGVVRVVSSIQSLPDTNHIRFIVVLIGQGLAAAAQPFLLFLPTKLAALWFADDQRAIANTIGSMSNVLGILVAMLLTPALVDSKNDIFLMNCVVLVPAVVVVILATFGVRRSTPILPPSASAAQTSLPFKQGLKLLFRKDAIAFWVLAVTLGGGVGLFNALYTIMQQVLCPKGYDDEFAGYCGAALIVGGIIGSVISGVFVDKTKLFEETAKVCYCLAAVVACALSVVIVRANIPVAILILMCLYGMCGFALYPIGLEMGVECTYPVAEATSAGIIILFGQLIGIILVILLGVLAQDPTAYDLSIEKCRSNPQSPVEVQDWLIPVMLWVLMSCIFAVCMTIFFRPKYKRMAAERKAAQKGIKQAGGESVSQSQQSVNTVSSTVTDVL